MVLRVESHGGADDGVDCRVNTHDGTRPEPAARHAVRRRRRDAQWARYVRRAGLAVGGALAVVMLGAATAAAADADLLGGLPGTAEGIEQPVGDAVDGLVEPQTTAVEPASEPVEPTPEPVEPTPEAVEPTPQPVVPAPPSAPVTDVADALGGSSAATPSGPMGETIDSVVAPVADLPGPASAAVVDALDPVLEPLSPLLSPASGPLAPLIGDLMGVLAPLATPRDPVDPDGTGSDPTGIDDAEPRVVPGSVPSTAPGMAVPDTPGSGGPPGMPSGGSLLGGDRGPGQSAGVLWLAAGPSVALLRRCRRISPADLADRPRQPGVRPG